MVVHPTKSLCLASAFLRVNALCLRGARGLGGDSPTFDPQRLGESRHEAVDRELTISKLASLVLRDRANDRPGLRANAMLLHVAECGHASTSNTASTRDSVLFACCPPGPLDLEMRSSISERGSTTERVTRRLVTSSGSVMDAPEGRS